MGGTRTLHFGTALGIQVGAVGVVAGPVVRWWWPEMQAPPV
jgi:hypothetical protein